MPFSRHPQKQMRNTCNSPLLKCARTASGRKLYPPIKVFCYQSIVMALRCFIQQPGMLTLLDHWKNRRVPCGLLCDIYDGSVWRSCVSHHVTNSLTLAFLINIDWFQPYKHIAYSVGAIYLTFKSSTATKIST